jgi:hypothetical protein
VIWADGGGRTIVVSAVVTFEIKCNQLSPPALANQLTQSPLEAKNIDDYLLFMTQGVPSAFALNALPISP